MKGLISSLLILVCFSSFSSAQQMKVQNDVNDNNVKDETMKTKKEMKSYTMVYYFLMNAMMLDLTDSQRQELDDIKKNYLYPMIEKDMDFQIFQLKVMDMLKEADFDPNKVKTAIEVSINLTRENAIMSIDALAAIRKAVGIDNYKNLIKMMSLMSSENLKSNEKEMKEEDTSNEHDEHDKDQQGI